MRVPLFKGWWIKFLAIWIFFFVYLDDILISSGTEEEHRKHLQEVFRLLQRAGLTINLPKSEFFAKELEFLSQCQQNHAVAQAHSMVKDYHVPRRKDEVSKFLGLLNFSAPSCLYPIEDRSSCQQLAWAVPALCKPERDQASRQPTIWKPTG